MSFKPDADLKTDEAANPLEAGAVSVETPEEKRKIIEDEFISFVEEIKSAGKEAGELLNVKELAESFELVTGKKLEEETKKLVEARAKEKGLHHVNEENILKVRAKNIARVRNGEILENIWESNYKGKSKKYESLEDLKEASREKIKELKKIGVDADVFCDLMNEGYKMLEADIGKESKSNGFFVKKGNKKVFIDVEKIQETKKGREIVDKNTARRQLRNTIKIGKKNWKAEESEAKEKIIIDAVAEIKKEREKEPTEAAIDLGRPTASESAEPMLKEVSGAEDLPVEKSEPAMETPEKEMERIQNDLVAYFEGIVSNYERALADPKREVYFKEKEYLGKNKTCLQYAKEKKFLEPVVSDWGPPQSIYENLKAWRDLRKSEMSLHKDEPAGGWREREYQEYKGFTDYIEGLHPELKTEELAESTADRMEEEEESRQEKGAVNEDWLLTPLVDEEESTNPEAESKINSAQTFEELYSLMDSELTPDPWDSEKYGSESLSRWVGWTRANVYHAIESGKTDIDEIFSDASTAMDSVPEMLRDKATELMRNEISSRLAERSTVTPAENIPEPIKPSDVQVESKWTRWLKWRKGKK